MTIVMSDASTISGPWLWQVSSIIIVTPQFGVPLIDDCRGIIYDRNKFIIQAAGACTIKLFTAVIYGFL